MIKKNRSSGGLRMVIGTGVVVSVVLLVVGFAAFKLIKNPFTTQTIDRTPPPMLKELHELSEYRAASREFEVLVDIEKDVKYIPEFLAGEKVLFVGVGEVDAYVDFRTLGDDAVDVSFDGTKVTVTLPRAQLGTAVVDPARSHVADRDRGLLDRLSGMLEDNPTSEQELYIAAQQKMADAALADGQLLVEAEKNTREMLDGLMKAAGFTSVEVVFEGTTPKA